MPAKQDRPKLDRRPSSPAGLEDHVSRREAARLLGFGSDFKVRQLEKEGRLPSVRGPLEQAWYPRAQVMALAGEVAVGPRQLVDPRGRLPESPPHRPGRWSDAALIAHLRAGSRTAMGSHFPVAPSWAPTVVDLVAETGVSIARAERVYRFWLTHDVHPAAATVRTARSASLRVAFPPLPVEAAENGAPDGAASAPGGERRAAARVQRDGLIQRLRDPDPAMRQAAFRKLQELRKSGSRAPDG